jgi:hypothetical protein
MGWLAMGFGSTMVGSPIVMLYTNSTGHTVLTQRLASGHSVPPVVNNPPRKATTYDTLRVLDTASTVFAFTIPANKDVSQNVIWAYCSSPPKPDGGLFQHDDSGRVTLNLGKTLDLSSPTPVPAPGSGGGNDEDVSMALSYTQRLMAAHGVLMTLAFLFFLPAGALLGRLGRTYTRSWFIGHSVLQGWICGPLILSGFIIAVVAVESKGIDHFSTTHKKVGLALFILYVIQASLGTIIHFFKPKPSKASHPALRRPPQNYLHAILGLTILGISFWQIRTGFDIEWSTTQDMDKFGPAVYRFWIAWVVIICVLYVGGLALLPRQFSQERPRPPPMETTPEEAAPKGNRSQPLPNETETAHKDTESTPSRTDST